MARVDSTGKIDWLVSKPLAQPIACDSFTIGDGQYGRLWERMTLAGTNRMTTNGSGRLVIDGAAIPATGSGFYATRLAGTVTMTNLLYTTVTFDTEMYDSDGCWDGTTYVAPGAGLYMFTGRAGVDNIDDAERVDVALYVNNEVRAYAMHGFAVTTANQNIYGSIAAVLYLSGGDAVTLRLRQAEGADQSLNVGLAHCWFSCARFR
jgi:hypothetical protein